MKSCTRRLLRRAFCLGLALLAPVVCTSAAPDQSSGAAPVTGITNAAAPSDIPQSTFVMPSNPKEGRNPFFPLSTMGVELPVKPIAPPTVDTSAFTLNGITGPPKPTAMINGRTFEAGEEAEVKLPNGARALIKCEEIKANSTVILFAGVHRELRLRLDARLNAAQAP